MNETNASDRIEGVLIAESLRAEAVLRDLQILVSAIDRVRVDEPSPGQPNTWTLITFTADNRRAELLADAFSQSLQPGPWYVDFRSATDVYVVFSGKAFRYSRGDIDARGAVIDHARSVGVPEQQCDWG